MASVYKRKYTYADGTVRYAKKYTIDYVDKDGKTRTIAGYKDKRLSEDLARQLEKNAERERAGLPPIPLTDSAKNDRYGSGHAMRRRPLGEAITQYLAELTRKGTPATSNHYRESRRILTTLAERCHWECLADIRADAFTTFLGQLAQQGRAPRTQNRYHETLRAFLNWCVRQSWIEESPMDKLRMVKQSGTGRRYRRRAYSVDEWRRLMNAAPEPRKTVYLAN